MTFAGGRGPVFLADGATRDDLSVECREAALAFTAGASAGWDKRGLALWLAGPYAHATRHLPRGERVTGPDGAIEEIEAAAIDDLVSRARGEILGSLDALASLDATAFAAAAGSLELVEDALASGHVRKATDVDGSSLWLPVDGARMRLVDRVRSLFAADFLNTPEAYVDLYVCARCEAVVFDEGAKKLGMCGAHMRSSGIVVRDEETAVLASASGASAAAR